MRSSIMDMSLLEGLDLGVGVDPILHKLHGWLFDPTSTQPAWIDPLPNDSTLPSGGAAVVDFIQTTEELERRVAASAFADYSGASFSASGSAKFMNELKTSSNSAYLLIDIEVYLTAQMLRAPVPKEEHLDWIKRHTRDEFEQKFGTHYVSGIKSGGRFVGVITVHGMAESSKREFHAELRASGWGSKAGVNFDQAFSKTKSSHRITAQSMWSGGKEVVSYTPDEMLAAAKGFPDRVRAQPFPYTAILREYGASILLPEFKDESIEAREHRWERMRALARDRQQYVTLQRDIEFTVDHIWDQERGEGVTFKEHQGLTHAELQKRLGYWLKELATVRERLDQVNSAARKLQDLTNLPTIMPFYQPNEPIPTIEGESIMLKEIQEKLEAIPPIGSIILWSGSTSNIPKGWLLCDGTHGTPDLRERFILGAGTTVPHKSGEPDQHQHSIDPPAAKLTIDSVGDHAHAMAASWYFRRVAAGNHHGIDTGSPAEVIKPTQPGGHHTHTGRIDIQPFTSTASTDANRPKWYALCFIMRTT